MEDRSKNENQKSLIIRLLPVVVLAVGFASFFLLGLDRYVNFEGLRENRLLLTNWVEQAGLLAGLAFVLLYFLVVAFSLPAAGLMTITAGFLFGTIAATGFVVVGATLGACALFLAAKTALGDSLKNGWAQVLKSCRPVSMMMPFPTCSSCASFRSFPSL